MTRLPVVLLGCALGINLSLSPAVAGLFDDMQRLVQQPSKDAGKSINDSLDEVVKGVEQMQQGSVEWRPDRPEIEQSPTNPCKVNPSLPQCEYQERYQ